MKNIKLFFYFYFFILFILFFLGIFFDYQISNFFAILKDGNYYSLNIYAIIVEIFGEFPFYLLISICFIVFCVYANEIKNKIIKFSVQFLSFLNATGILFLAFLRTSKFASNYVNISLDILTLIALAFISIIVCALFFVMIKKINFKNMKNLFWFAIIIFAVSLVAIIVVQIIKNNICFRPRFRTINYLHNSNLFKPCWNCFKFISIQDINLPSDACQSFPSGHTMTASILLCFVFLPKIFKIKSNTKYLCWILPIIYLIFVGLGRIVAGAHFLTDVTFSAIFVGVLYLIFFEIIFKKKIIA